MGSGDSLVAGDDPEVSIVAVEETAEEKQGKEDTENLTDPLNTYLQVRLTCSPYDTQPNLQVGNWIAQWDAPYEAWYFYNTNTGGSKRLRWWGVNSHNI